MARSIAAPSAPSAPRMTARFQPTMRERIRRAGLLLLAAVVSIWLLATLPTGDESGLDRLFWFLVAVPGFLFAVGTALGARSARATPLGAVMSMTAVGVFGLIAAQAVPGVAEELLRPERDGRLLVAVMVVFVLVTLATLTLAVHLSDRIAVVVAAGIAPLAVVIAVTGYQVASMVPRCPTPTVPPGAAGQLAFAFRGFICVADLDTGTVRAVTREASPGLVTTDPATIGRNPALSPDGRGLAFHVNGELWLARLDGDSPPAMIGLGEEPSWSPDGRSIVVARHARATTTIVLLEIASGAERMLAVPPDLGPADGSSAWSPDGGSIAVVLQRGSLWLLDVQTGQGRSVAGRRTDRWVDSPVWRPDGEVLAVVAFGAGSAGIHSVNVDDGSQRDSLTPDPQSLVGCFEPAWSPDGRYIACVKDVSWGTGSLVIVELATGAQTRTGITGASPAWSVSPARGP